MGNSENIAKEILYDVIYPENIGNLVPVTLYGNSFGLFCLSYYIELYNFCF